MNKKNFYSELSRLFNPQFLIATILISVLSTGMLSVFNINTASAQANAGIWDSYLKLAGKDYYLGNSGNIPPVFTTNSLSKPVFNGTNLGAFSSTSTLDLNGAWSASWKPTSGPGNICGAYLYYAVYATGSTPGFTELQLNDNGTSGNKGSYFWQVYFDTTQSINIIGGLTPGNYSLAVYIVSTGSETGSDCNTNIMANGLPDTTAGAYYVAHFTIKGLICPPGAATGKELITNGAFHGTSGFTTGYTYTPAPTVLNNSEPGEYYIGTAAEIKTWNSTFVSSGAPGGAADSFMVVDGNNPAPPYLKVWSETVTVLPNTSYVFSFYVSSMDAIQPANLYLYAGNTPFGGEISLPGTSGNWVKITKAWCSGSTTSITFSIIDSNNIKVGNDFGLDSISLRSNVVLNSISAGPDTTICNGNKVMLTPTPGACAYYWSPSAGLNNDSLQNPLASPTITTTYKLKALVNNCTIDTLRDSVVVTVGTNIPISAGGNVTTCPGVGVVLHGSGGTDYAWTPTTGLSSATIADPTATPTVTTTYYLTASTSSGCKGTDSAIVTVSNTLKATIHPADTTVCSGQPVQFQASGASQYSWLPATALSSSTISNPVASPTQSTTYTVTISDGTGCTAAATIAVNITTTIPVSAGSPASICSGKGTVLNGTGGTSYSWSPASGLSSATIADPTATPTATTTYTLTATNGSCSGTATVVITVGAYTPSIIPADTTLCSGRPAQLNITSGATTATWTPATGLSNADIVDPIATPTTSTTYTATISNSSGCTATATVAINVNPGYKAGQVVADPDTICPTTLANLSVSGNSSGAIQWLSSSSAVGGYSSISGATKASYTSIPLTKTTYYRAVVGSGACADTTAAFTITVVPAPTASFTFKVNGQAVTFTSSTSTGIISYYWNYGDKSSDTIANPTHTFSKVDTFDVCLTVKNNTDCNYTTCQNVVTFPTGINNIANSNAWLVYPDPFGAQLYISTGSSGVKANKVEVFDVLGRRVFVANDVLQNPIKLDLSSLVAGAYFVRITTPQGEFIKKVIKD